MSRDYKHTINLPTTDFAMKADLARREPVMLAEWESSQRYADLQRHTGKRGHAFILHDGPPYANGKIHLGHAVNKILKDIVVRSKLVAGFRSPYVPGWDCHGLPIEIAVEKKYGKVGHKIDAAAFRQHCRDYATQQIDLQRADFKRLGVLGDWEHPYRTMDFKYEADILRALADVYANGHVARGFKPVHWCFDCGSALAEAEIEYADKQSPAIDVAYDALDPKALAAKFGASVDDDTIVSVPIWTTTPWTLPASMAVSLGPELEYVLVEGPRRGNKRVLLVLAEALADKALARYQPDFLPPLAGTATIHGQELRGARRADGGILGRAKGALLENLRLRHPFYDREVTLILGDHVSAEEGTGAVHTAPGHGADDFTVGQRYGIVAATPSNVLNPVGPNGVYLPGTPIFEGQHIWKANDAIIDLLRERGVLLAAAKITHSYPHCWRHHTPIAFRTTPQWFIVMDAGNLRASALHAIHHDVKFFPAWGEERINNMVEGRPDWCISRQRTWGVPIALCVHKVTGEPHPRSAELLREVAKHVELGGVDAWHALDVAGLLGDEAKDYEKVHDILDVWFDSGVSHYCVLDQRPELHRNEGDRVMYLEGSDQHRGWFQSSLLTSCAIHGHAPFDEVLTHGFTVDAQGRKMSKSLGNGIEPQDVMNRYGADILRLWIASADYRNEMALSDEILKRVADSYRRIRNTCRFLLGNLDGFDPVRDLLAVDRCLLLDQWAVHAARDVQDAVVAAYARYDFPEVVQRVQNFCTNEMGALYLDITKDRLYTMPAESHGRRSAQSSMYRILEAMVRWLAPLLAFTAEEVWQAMPRQMHVPTDNMPTKTGGGFTARGASVLFETWYQGLHETQNSPEQRRWWSDLLAIRETAGRVLEGMRKDGRIGSSLDATLTIHADPAIAERYKQVAGELRFFFIVSDLRLDIGEAPAEAVLTELDGANVWLSAAVSDAPKCVRCWHHRADVGSHAGHPELCGRCVENVEACEGRGAGETRRWF
ncbi:MAG: isoleucine--tRNA ligase [Xanthomonadales bacterium]|nr:isoleucine--tRNA ligase [Xanthomonadales bacterium]ODU91786.1 MAG: isoleucine--tRNA ligase [Rhodanobacter sp. SCN 66-43]OJY82717.1 MAG: isoleucine--tRNA ligase [Xanthomonadales bacterium 66-474]